MKIVTTPMCEEIVKLAGVSDYSVNKFPCEKDGDIAVLLSESKVDMPSLRIKLNTPNQIFESIGKVSNLAGTDISSDEILSFFDEYKLSKKYLNSHFKNDVKVKVYSEFLKDIVLDMGFNVVEDGEEFVVFPDYLKSKIGETDNLVEIPSHGGVSKNPFERIELRYSILENLI